MTMPTQMRRGGAYGSVVHDGIVEQRLAPLQLSSGHRHRRSPEVSRRDGVRRSEHRRPLERACGGVVAGAPGGEHGRRVKRSRRLLVWADGGVGEVPCALLHVALIERVGQQAMGLTEIERRGELDDHRAQERVAEAHALRAEDEDAGGLGRREVGWAARRGFERRHHRPPPPVLADCCDQDRAAPLGLEALDPPLIGAYQRLADRQVSRQRRPARALSIVQGAGQFLEGEGIARRQADERSAHRVGQRLAGLIEEPSRVLVIEWADPNLRDLHRDATLRRGLTCCCHDQHGIVVDPARAEPECFLARYVDPVDVIDDHEQRAIAGDSGEQAEGSRVGREAVSHAWRPERECRLERRTLGPGQIGASIDDGEEEVRQAEERQTRLGLHTSHAEHADALGVLAKVLEQGGFPNARLTTQEERAAAARAGGVEHPTEVRPLLDSTDDHTAIVMRRARRCRGRTGAYEPPPLPGYTSGARRPRGIREEERVPVRALLSEPSCPDTEDRHALEAHRFAVSPPVEPVLLMGPGQLPFGPDALVASLAEG